jgi:hypothetical protein
MSFALSDYYAAVGDYVPTLSTLSTVAVYRQINKARRIVARQTDATLTTYNFSFIPAQQPYPYPTVNGCIMKYIMETYYYIGNVRFPFKGSLPQMTAGADPMLNYNGWPVAYYLLNDNVYYWPVPSFAYNAYIKGKLDPIDITATGGTDAIIPNEFQDAVVMQGSKLCALLDSKLELAASMELLYRDALSSLPREFM